MAKNIKSEKSGKKEVMKIDRANETPLQKGFRRACLTHVLTDPKAKIEKTSFGYRVTLYSSVYNFNTTSKSFF